MLWFRGISMKRALIPLVIFVGLVAMLVVELTTKKGIECRVCISFNGRSQCATARGDDEQQASTEAQSSACSLLTSGVSEAFKCPRLQPDEVVCK